MGPPVGLEAALLEVCGWQAGDLVRVRFDGNAHGPSRDATALIVSTLEANHRTMFAMLMPDRELFWYDVARLARAAAKGTIWRLGRVEDTVG